MKFKELDEWDISMLESCYCYGDLHGRYVEAIVKKCGKGRVNKAIQNIKNTYRIVENVHTDHEGLTYNSLVKREDN